MAPEKIPLTGIEPATFALGKRRATIAPQRLAPFSSCYTPVMLSRSDKVAHIPTLPHAAEMSGKTLSTSTLSLRFMQNAQRAKQLKEVELEKAAVHDDAQWDVGQEVREAWGLLSEQDPLYAIALQ